MVIIIQSKQDIFSSSSRAVDEQPCVLDLHEHQSPLTDDEVGQKAPFREDFIAGVDEAGRGPLAGPVIAAAVILNPNKPIPGLADSKTLSAKQREALAAQIYEHAFAWAIGRAEVEEIDTHNILNATLIAMQRAVAGLAHAPQRVLIDGIHSPLLACHTQTIIKGDQTHSMISAASILAKVTRDAEMVLLDQSYPAYGFAKHKGYGTTQHLAALKKYGCTPHHRQSFAPCRNE